MANRLARYHEVAALAEKPTPIRRLIAAVVAGALAFLLTQLLLGTWWALALLSLLFPPLGQRQQQQWQP